VFLWQTNVFASSISLILSAPNHPFKESFLNGHSAQGALQYGNDAFIHSLTQLTINTIIHGKEIMTTNAVYFKPILLK